MFRGDTLPISSHDEDLDVATFDVSERAQLLQERAKDNGIARIGPDGNKSDTRERGSLCARAPCCDTATPPINVMNSRRRI
jgi:hypothetical protein